jgi:hypothetical protein
MTTLSWKEQRRLRRIERDLRRNDPRLAELLSRPTERKPYLSPPAPVRRSSPPQGRGPASTASIFYFAVAVLLILRGNLFGDMRMVLGGVVALAAFLLVAALVAAVHRAK